MRLGGLIVVGLSMMTMARPAAATAGYLFGWGPRDIALAQSDVADAASVAAAWVNPSLAWEPGARMAVGYVYGWTALEWNGERVKLRDIAGTQVGFQLGGELGSDIALGGAVVMHIPDRSLARVSFLPGTEPVFFRFDPASQRTTMDAVLALRLGWLSIGVGGEVFVSAQGDVDFVLGQDANGTYADGEAQVTLAYDVTWLAGLTMDLGAAKLGLRYRGAQALDVDLSTLATVDVQGNPLNGTTKVRIVGRSGYVPATVDLGASWTVGAVGHVMTSLQYARWSDAPSPVAALSMDVDLGLSPGLRQGSFVMPGFRDTVSPRVGMEMEPWGEEAVALRAGYQYSPSPVRVSRGFASPMDASTHGFALGAGVDCGRVWGVDIRSDAAWQWLMLERRTLDKPGDALPFSHSEVSGSVKLMSVSVQGGWL